MFSTLLYVHSTWSWLGDFETRPQSLSRFQSDELGSVFYTPETLGRLEKSVQPKEFWGSFINQCELMSFWVVNHLKIDAVYTSG